LVYILKLFIRAALWIFCTEVNVNNRSLLKTKGPLLIIANHPNSFLDAIIIGAQYKRRIHFLARGDVFTKKHHRFLLGLLNMIPVYRQREGKQYLHLNEYAFNKSAELLEKQEAVLIFIEGICVNKNEIQPFKKGTSRIIERIQAKKINPKIHIATLAYNNFKGIGKKVNISIVNLTNTHSITTAKDRVLFNQKVAAVLNENIFIPATQTKIIKTPFYYLHLPYYFTLQKFVYKKTKGTVFYDSVLFALLFFTYPLFLFLLYIILCIIGLSQPIIFCILVAIPIISKQSIQ
jgi:1-acyl-sn-glycerol-3-phosphate acyltransferase